MREAERERENRHTDRKRQGERDREGETDRDRQRQTDTQNSSRIVTARKIECLCSGSIGKLGGNSNDVMLNSGRYESSREKEKKG